jgi:hypothetical protein
LGEVEVGELCLFVFTSSKHRKAAMDACDELVERIKTELPVWGKEILDTHATGMIDQIKQSVKDLFSIDRGVEIMMREIVIASSLKPIDCLCHQCSHLCAGVRIVTDEIVDVFDTSPYRPHPRSFCLLRRISPDR